MFFISHLYIQLCPWQESFISALKGYHLAFSPGLNTVFQFLLGRVISTGKLPTFLIGTSSIFQETEEGEEEQNLTKMVIFNGNQRYSYNYIVRHKKTLGWSGIGRLQNNEGNTGYRTKSCSRIWEARLINTASPCDPVCAHPCKKKKKKIKYPLYLSYQSLQA